MEKNEIIETLKKNIIKWCRNNGKKISDIQPKRKDGKINSLAVQLTTLTYMFDDMDDLTKIELTNYGMPWPDELKAKLPTSVNQEETKKVGRETVFVDTRIKEELIPYLIKNNFKIPDIPATIDGKQNPMYSLIAYIKNRAELCNISKESIELLNKYEMIWEKFKGLSAEERILAELIPYCEYNNIYIYEISKYDENGKLNSLFSFVNNLKQNLKKANYNLPNHVLNLLEKHLLYKGGLNPRPYGEVKNRGISSQKAPTLHKVGTVFDNSSTITTNQLKAELKVHLQTLIKWMDRHLAYIQNINSKTTCWEDLQFVIKYNSFLTEEEYEELRLYGFSRSMTVESEKPKKGKGKKANSTEEANTNQTSNTKSTDSNTALIREMINKQEKLANKEKEKSTKVIIHKLEDKIKKLVDWLIENVAFISDIEPTDPIYKNLLYIRKHKNLLTEDQIAELSSYGYEIDTTNP